MNDSTCDRLSQQYFGEMNSHPVLGRDEEAALAREYQKTRCSDVAEKLLQGNLRFVAKIAHEYKGYGLPLLDLVQEGNMGLIVAIEKFNPSLGYRLASYAVWWIRAYIQSFVMRNWSLVKIGTTQAQRRLFFKVRSARSHAEREAGADNSTCAEDLAERFGVKESDIHDMEMRLSDHDVSIDTPVAQENGATHKDVLPSLAQTPETTLETQQMQTLLRDVIEREKPNLNTKELYVLENRILKENPPTLRIIGDELNVSRERVRQLENRVIGKLRHSMKSANAIAA